MMIRTHYVRATEGKGSKIHVHADGKQITVSYPYGENDPHLYAARLMASTLGLGDPDSLECVGELSRGFKYSLKQ